MALGDVTEYPGGLAKSIVLLATRTTTNSPPSQVTDGLAMSAIENLFPELSTEAALLVYSTAGSGTMTCTCRLWGYHPGPAAWFPLGTGTDGAKGIINAGSATGETGSDVVRHCEVLSLAGIAGSRLYLEITAIGGTSTSIEAAIVVRRGYAL